MENKINIAELLKGCPSGMELDCISYNGTVCFKELDSSIFPINISIEHDGEIYHHRLTEYGQTCRTPYNKCVIFPKGKSTWEGFVPPYKFKDGDIVVTTLNNIAIISGHVKKELFYIHALMVGDNFYNHESAKVFVKRHATEEEKEKLFKAIKANGYKWNAETKTLEKLIEPKFKVGDKIRKKNQTEIYLVSELRDNHYLLDEKDTALSLFAQDDWELVLDKFDISTLKPYDKVLVRSVDSEKWKCDFFSNYEETYLCKFKCVGCNYQYCIPYKGNEHLLGTTNDCSEYYKTWED